jgi:hypothetical protein
MNVLSIPKTNLIESERQLSGIDRYKQQLEEEKSRYKPRLEQRNGWWPVQERSLLSFKYLSH